MNPTDFGTLNPARPSQQSTPEDLALARRHLLCNAPDLLDMVLGAAS